MKLSALGAALLAGCVSGGARTGPCGAARPVDVIVDSNQFADVTIRDAEGKRLGMAYGHRISRFRFCAYSGMPARFILDPLAGELGYIVDGGMDPQPGSTVLITLGSELRISFAAVIPPEPE
jgi:hypothetical protein